MKPLLLIIPREDKPYEYIFKKLVTSTQVTVMLDTTVDESVLLAFCHRGTYCGIVSSSPRILSIVSGIQVTVPTYISVEAEEFSYMDDGQEEVVNTKVKGVVTISDIEGSAYFYRGTTVVAIGSLKKLVTIPYQPMLVVRYLNKILLPTEYLEFPKFQYEIVTNQYTDTALLAIFNDAQLCSMDIEKTYKITMIGFSLLMNDNTIKNLVLPINSMNSVYTMRMLLDTSVPKITHRGIYDITNLLHYNSPVRNWKFDTILMFYATYCELPKALDNVSAYYLKDFQYWKHESASDQLMYNAKDCYTTLCCAISWLVTAPQYAKTNYLLKFRSVLPCIHMNLQGVQIDRDVLEQARVEQTNIIDTELSSIRTMVGVPDFNPRSYAQVRKMLKWIGEKDASSSDAKHLKKVQARNILGSVIIPKILKWSKAAKLMSTYITASMYPNDGSNTLLYAYNPWHTSTARLSCKSSDISRFYYSATGLPRYDSYGTQIQNLPKYFKKCIVPPKGMYIAEIDKSASESWCTAYISNDINMLSILHSGKDYHCSVAELMFGIPYEQLYDTVNHVVLNNDIRQSAKTVGHGFNYNMGARVLLDNIGELEAFKIRGLLLHIPEFQQAKTALRICELLILRASQAFPNIRGKWQEETVRTVLTTGKLTAPTGYTFRLFGNPKASKPALNAYMALIPQHTSSLLVELSMYDFWAKYCLDTPNVRLMATTHDSIAILHTEETVGLIKELDRMMLRSIHINDKTLTIPNSASGYMTDWADNGRVL